MKEMNIQGQEHENMENFSNLMSNLLSNISKNMGDDDNQVLLSINGRKREKRTRNSRRRWKTCLRISMVVTSKTLPTNYYTNSWTKTC